jgi:transposase, IS5 family
MIVDRYDPVNLFELVPKLNLHFEPELARLDELLDDDELFNLVKAELLKRYPNSSRLGRHSTPVEDFLIRYPSNPSCVVSSCDRVTE